MSVPTMHTTAEVLENWIGLGPKSVAHTFTPILWLPSFATLPSPQLFQIGILSFGLMALPWRQAWLHSRPSYSWLICNHTFSAPALFNFDSPSDWTWSSMEQVHFRHYCETWGTCKPPMPCTQWMPETPTCFYCLSRSHHMILSDTATYLKW